MIQKNTDNRIVVQSDALSFYNTFCNRGDMLLRKASLLAMSSTPSIAVKYEIELQGSSVPDSERFLIIRLEEVSIFSLFMAPYASNVTYIDSFNIAILSDQIYLDLSPAIPIHPDHLKIEEFEKSNSYSSAKKMYWGFYTQTN